MTELGAPCPEALDLHVDAVREESAETVRLAYAADVGAELVPESFLAPRRSLP